MLYISTTFVDSNGFQVLARYGRPLKNLAAALANAQHISMLRGVAEIRDEHLKLVAAFRSGEAVSGSVLS